MPRLSVIIPAFNSERFISSAIDSVLSQGYSDLEIIVVNDGSSDGTEAALGRYGSLVRVIAQENAGPSAARNVGLAAATGDVVGFLDADDIWTDGHISNLLPHVTEGGYDLARGLVQTVCDLGTDQELRSEAAYIEPLVGACLYRKSLIDRVGRFDESMRQGEDFDWHARIVECGAREKSVDKITLLYRRHDSNITNARDQVKNGMFVALRKKLERQRSKQ